MVKRPALLRVAENLCIHIYIYIEKLCIYVYIYIHIYAYNIYKYTHTHTHNLVLVHLNDEGGFKVLHVIVGLDLLVELAGADGRNEARVAHRNTDPRSGLEEALSAIQALGRQFIVPKRAQQFRHDQVRQHRRVEISHVREHHLHIF
jgi:hypothetical protein